MFQRQVASTNSGRGSALRHGTQPGPQNNTQGAHCSPELPSARSSVGTRWHRGGAATGLAGGIPGFSVLCSFAFKASFGVSEIEFPLRSLLRFPMCQTKRELLSWASTIISQKTKTGLASCRRTVHRGLLRGETCLGLRILGCFKLTGMYGLSALTWMDREATDRTQNHNPTSFLQNGQS